VSAYKIKGIMFSDIEKCVCKIIRKTKIGTGFFCDIPEKNIKLLITNNHIIDEIYLEEGNIIAYMISENEKETFNEIDLEKDRYKLTNKELDFTIIEILKEDNIKNFLKINNEQYKLMDEIFSYQYAGGVKLGFSFGNLLKIDKNLLTYNVGTKGGSSGSPLLLMQNSKVIGLHKQGLQIHENEKINFGVPIEAIINKISYIKCTYEIMNYNYTQIINNTDGIEVNKDIESKIKILNSGREEKLILTKKFDKIGMNIIYFSIKEKLNDLSFLFNNCSTLKSIDFISFETDKVTNMRGMFQSCQKLEDLNLTNFNTSKVTNMFRMFKCCNKLKQIRGINNFVTSQVTNMKEMFQSCSELDYLDLTNFDISKVTDKESIFNGCNKLKQIKGGEKFYETKKNIVNNKTSTLLNENPIDKKSSIRDNSYHYNYNDYSNDSFSLYSNKEEKKCCKFCGNEINYENQSPLDDDYCFDCCQDPD
jgi:surface protein